MGCSAGTDGCRVGTPVNEKNSSALLGVDSVNDLSFNSVRQPYGNGSRGDSVFRDTALRSTLLGEYASLLLLCHSLFGVVCWSLYLPLNPAGLIMVGGGLWTAFRAVGGFAGERWTAGVSALMLLMTGTLAITGVSNVPPWLGGSLVAPSVWVAMLSVILLVDFLDWRASATANMTAVEKRKLNGRTLKLAFAGLFLAWGVGVPVATLIHQLSRPPMGKAQIEEMSFIAHVGFRSGEALVTACFFVLGCNIGSFLNVVGWRMPLGKSIVYEESRCPACSATIAGKDNIPIFGWLQLGGRCRSCSVEISPRYPIVEAITGGMFLLLYFVELISGGANLPVRPINMYRGVLWIIMYPKWDLIGLYLYHCFLFSSLLVFTLMAIDGNRIPRKLLAFCFGIGIVAPVVFPNLTLIPVLVVQIHTPLLCVGDADKAIFHGAAGYIAGVLAGGTIRMLTTRCRFKTGSRTGIVPSMCLIGATLGWQAAACVAALTLVLSMARFCNFPETDRDRSWPVASKILVAAFVHHVLWRFEWVYANH